MGAAARFAAVAPPDQVRHRLLPILGPSGSGKSSLARAGLIPQLARTPLPGWKDSRVAVLTPGSHPVEALAGVLARIVTNDPAPVERTQEFERVLKRQSDAGGRASVVITLRTDFLGETHTHELLNDVICNQQVMVPAMKEAELRAAIAKPAELAGHPLDDATVTLLTGDAKDREGALPLLQFALTRIWEGITRGVAPADTYRQIGGVGGALAGEAQRIYDDLGDDEKRIAKRVFLGLVQLGEGTRDTRRRAAVEKLITVGEDAGDVERVIRRFAGRDARLITLSSDERGRADTAEVTHEALFGHWTQLNDWLDENRDDIRFSRRLDEAAHTWDRQERPEGGLWRPPNLDLLSKYHERVGNEMTPLQMDFFIAAVRAEEELVLAKQREDLRLRNRTRIATGAAIVALVLLAASVGLLVFALRSRSSAIEARNRAVETERVAQEGRIDALTDTILLAPPATAGERMESLAKVAAADALRNYATQRLRSTIDKPIPPDASPAERDALASGKANLAVALLRRGRMDKVRARLKHSGNPALRSYLIHWFSQAGTDPDLIAAQIGIEQAPSILQALILSLGEFDDSGFPSDKRETLVESLMEFYKHDPDPGVHAASEWSLRKWGHNGDVKNLRDEVAREFKERLKKETEAEPTLHKTSDDKRGWYVNSQGQTMVVLAGPVELPGDAPETEQGPNDDETLCTRARPFTVLPSRRTK